MKFPRIWTTIFSWKGRPCQGGIQIALALLLTICCANPLRAQVVGFWQFNEKSPGNFTDTNASAILDASGNGHHGTTALPLSYVAGSPAQGNSSAVTFTLSSDNVVVPDPTGAFNFSPGQSITLEALVRTYNIGQDGIGAIMNKQGANPGEWWWRINANGRQQFWIDDGAGGAKNVSGAAALNDGVWHHVAAVFDATAQQVRVYVDYALDGSAAAVYGTSGTIGNTNDFWIGAFQNGTRQFDGDMDFARVSLGALDPTNFVLPATYVVNLSPANDASFLSATNIASFSVKSPAIGVASSNILVTANGSNITSQLTFSGNDNDRTVTLPALADNIFYRVNISVTDLNSNRISQAWVFNTFVNNLFFIEGEDYNFGGGQFIDNPQLSSVPGPNNYLDRLGTEGIDFHQTNTPALAQYRIGDQVGTAVSLDVLRQAYLDAQVSDPGVADYMARDHANTEWLNYTRTFPAGTYRVFARLSKPGTVPVVAQLDEVTSGSTTSSQTLAPIGSFRRAPTGSDADYEFVPLTDAVGNEVGVPLSGIRTLRLTLVSGGANVNLNYFIFVPISGTQVPFAASVTPASGAGNEAFNATIQASIRNADTTAATNTIQLRLDGTNVAAAISGTSIGANVSFTPSLMATGLHTATLIFTDSASASVTNQWQFYVANRAVRGYWKFNEKTPGNFASTNAGAILDASGNARHGTANVGSMLYVTGSFNYSNTPALRFTSGADRVVIPDAAGNFTFTNSFTLEAVVRTTNVTAITGAILAKNGTGDGEGEFWWRFPGLAGGKQRLGLNSQIFLGGTNTLNDGLWHHLAVVYDQAASQVRLYADYAQEASAAFSLDRPIGRPADLQLGSFINGGSDFDGDIDLIRISDGALTPAQFVQTTVALQPIVKTLRPASGAKNVSPTTLIEAEFQNRDTAVVLSSLKLFIDGNDVTAGSTKTSTATTAKIDYTPATPLANGAHRATAIFDDTAVPANSWTNSWSFTNLAVIPVAGFYQFNEKLPGNTADTTTNAILDFSGNSRNGTVSAAGLPYVVGSSNHGNTSALRYTVAAATHVAVPDPTGAFNFNPTQSVTLEAVIRTVTIGQASVGSILAKQLAATPEWWWRINATGLQQFNVNDSSGAKSVSGTKVLNDGQWHHLAVIYDGQAKQMRAYVDYVQDGNTVTTTYASTTSTIGNAQDLWIGEFQAGNRIFDGDIDCARVTRAALDVSWFIPLGGIVSPVKLINVAQSGASIAFSFGTEVGRSYIIQATPALGSTWSDVETIPGDGTVRTVSYTITGEQQLFRVKTQ
jgi:hypothetical protein